ncbi:MAG: cell wall-binding repeat-containing protein [Clostridioides sp.]|nr:cell wall-binding repeat-containing protein [Clostridioides sp.]
MKKFNKSICSVLLVTSAASQLPMAAHALELDNSSTKTTGVSTNETSFENAFPDEDFRRALSGVTADEKRINEINFPTVDENTFSSVTKLSISNKSIQSLNGIQYFKNLNTLAANLNKLVDLDLTQNTKLTSISVADNQLKTLNIEGLTLLKTLKCEGNKLSNLEIGPDINLISLSCYRNNLTRLNVKNLEDYSKTHNANFYPGDSKDPQKPTVDLVKHNGKYAVNIGVPFNENSITDLSKGTYIDEGYIEFDSKPENLEEFNYEYVFGNSKLDSMTVKAVIDTTAIDNESKPTPGKSLAEIFPDANFRKALDDEHKINEVNYPSVNLNTFDNITELKLEDKAIKSVDGIEYFQNLQKIDLDKNNLTSLDLSNNKKLVKLICRDNFLTELDLTGLTEINYLNLDGNNVKDLNLKDQSKLLNLFARNNKMTRLDLSPVTGHISPLYVTNQLPELEVEQMPDGKFGVFIGKVYNDDLIRDIDYIKNPNGSVLKTNPYYTADGYIVFDKKPQDGSVFGYTYQFNKFDTAMVDDMSVIVTLKVKADLGGDEELPDNPNTPPSGGNSGNVGGTYTPSPSPQIPKSVELAGNDRFDTSVQISKSAFEKAENVVLVNNSSIADALSVTPFAKAKKAPVLLTEKSKLNSATEEEIKRLKAENIYIIGGKNSADDNLENSLRSKGYKVTRISGENRYDTSLKLAEELSKIVDIKEMSVVNGSNGLADAVSVSGISAQKGMPILLTAKDSDLKDAKAFAIAQNIKTTYVVGGPSLFSGEVTSLPAVDRVSGANRNETNAKIIDKFYTNSKIDNLYVVKNGMSGDSHLIDSLSAGVVAGMNESPMIIVGNELSVEQRELLGRKTFSSITKVGGNGNEKSFSQIKEIFSK